LKFFDLIKTTKGKQMENQNLSNQELFNKIAELIKENNGWHVFEDLCETALIVCRQKINFSDN
jgi:hypothetical protein